MHFISPPILSSAVISNMTPDYRLPIIERTENEHEESPHAFAHLWQAKYSAPYAQELTQGRNEHSAGKDEHSLEHEHVNGVSMTTDDWNDLFDVKPGDKLYLQPEERTHIW